MAGWKGLEKMLDDPDHQMKMARHVARFPNICRECGEKSLTWSASVQNTGGCVDGRLRLHEVQPIFVLGCECCSETMMIVSADEIADLLNTRGTDGNSTSMES